MHVDLKQLILTSWRCRWSEKEWSIHICKHLLQPSDVFHVADALVCQTFIGTSPNSLLLDYVWHALNTGLLTYSSVITAISKHEDLHRVESTRGIYELLQRLMILLNSKPIREDGMDLCCSLRMILQWLLRNIEQYLKGVKDVSANVAEELIKLDCHSLEELTTKPRTSALLTVARFEESGVWSHIETDLAVIKNSSGQHSLHAEISKACHHVSQLSRISITAKSIYTHMPSLEVCLPVSSLIMLEVETMKLTEGTGIAQQLMLLSKVLGLSMTQLIFHALQAALMGYLDSVVSKTGKEPYWCALIFLRLPKTIVYIKSSVVGSEFDSPSGITSRKSSEFDSSVFKALEKIACLDSLFDTIDNFGDEFNWMKLITDHYVTKNLITENDARKLQSIRNGQRENMSRGTRMESPANPLTIVKAETTVEQLVAALGSFDVSSEQERIWAMLQSICNCKSFDTYIAAASATGQLSSFASKLLLCNDYFKASAGETVKGAQTRALLFDITFLMVCRMMKIFGKQYVFEGFHSSKNVEMTYLLHWLDAWWLPYVKGALTGKLEVDANRVDKLINSLKTYSEFKVSLAKWNDMCTNLPHAILEFIKARQQGYISSSDLNRIVRYVRDHYPLSICLAIIALVAQSGRLVSGHADYIAVLHILATKSDQHSQLSHLYDHRYEFFVDVAEHFMSSLVPEFWKNGSVANVSSTSMLREAYSEIQQTQWIDHHRLKMLTVSYNQLGVVAFMRQILCLVLKETRLNAIQNAVYVAFSCMRVDIESCMVYLLQHGIKRCFMSEAHVLAPPVGLEIAKMTVAGLDIALDDAVLREKSILPKHELSPFLHKTSTAVRRNDSGLKVRRMLSCSTEHDLAASSGVAGLSPDHPILVVLGEFLQSLWISSKTHRSGPIADFVVTFIKLALHSTPLLSRTVKQCIPPEMARDLGFALVEQSRELLFAASDLGNPDVRRVVAQAVCQTTSFS